MIQSLDPHHNGHHILNQVDKLPLFISGGLKRKLRQPWKTALAHELQLDRHRDDKIYNQYQHTTSTLVYRTLHMKMRVVIFQKAYQDKNIKLYRHLAKKGHRKNKKTTISPDQSHVTETTPHVNRSLIIRLTRTQSRAATQTT